MFSGWRRGFTIVELLIVIVILATLTTVIIVAYNGITRQAMSAAAKSDLRNVDTAMQLERQETGSYPTALPDDFTASNNINVTLPDSGSLPYYSNLTTVQSGVLFAKTCQDLIDAGYGKGTSQGGQVRDYVTGCGNWNDDSMQVTGWDSRVWPTPVQRQPLLDYGANFTASAWDIDQERVMEQFYRLLVKRYEQQGGSFPITSFWDYWATPTNGGVQLQPLNPNAPVNPFYCAEAGPSGYPDLIWHITHTGSINQGSCLLTF